EPWWREILFLLSKARKPPLPARCEGGRPLHIRVGCRSSSQAMKNRASWLPQTTECAQAAHEWESQANGEGWHAARDRDARHFHLHAHASALRTATRVSRSADSQRQPQPERCASLFQNAPLEGLAPMKLRGEHQMLEPARGTRRSGRRGQVIRVVHQEVNHHKETSPKVARPQNAVLRSTKADLRATHQLSNIIRFSGRKACSSASEPEGESEHGDVRA